MGQAHDNSDAIDMWGNSGKRGNSTPPPPTTPPVDMTPPGVISSHSPGESRSSASNNGSAGTNIMEDSSLPPAKKAGKPNGFDILFGYLGLLFLPVVPLVIGLGIMLAGTDPNTLSNPEAATTLLTETLSKNPVFLIFAMIFTWAGLSIGVWTAGRKTAGGWKRLVNWTVSWKPDILLALAFTIFFMIVQIAMGALLQTAGVETDKLGNTDFATSQTGVALIFIFLGVAIGAPLFEELFFRGVFYNVVSRKWGVIAGIVISSIGFGLVHVQDSLAASLYTCTATALLGAGLAYLYSRTGRIGTSILAHGFFNATSLTITLLFGMG